MGFATAILTTRDSVLVSMAKNTENVRTIAENTTRFPDFQAEYRKSQGSQATDSKSNLSWLQVPDLNLPFDKLLRLGGRSEEISQICVVWGKAVAVS
jgi:hypothetical protein